MIPVTSLRAGAVFKEKGEPFLVVKYTHTKMGRGGATIKLKVKNLKSKIGAEKTFASGAVVEEAEVEKARYQFLYCDEDQAFFMNGASFEQEVVDKAAVERELAFLKSGQGVYILKFEGRVVDLELPPNVDLKVIATEPGFKGDSAAASLKPAEVETGLTLSVPLFIKVGDVVKVDTRTGKYVGRV